MNSFEMEILKSLLLQIKIIKNHLNNKYIIAPEIDQELNGLEKCLQESANIEKPKTSDDDLAFSKLKKLAESRKMSALTMVDKLEYVFNGKL